MDRTLVGARREARLLSSFGSRVPAPVHECRYAARALDTHWLGRAAQPSHNERQAALPEHCGRVEPYPDDIVKACSTVIYRVVH